MPGSRWKTMTAFAADRLERKVAIAASRLAACQLDRVRDPYAVAVAHKVIDENKRLELTEKDSLRADLLDNPPAPNDKLLAAAIALPKR